MPPDRTSEGTEQLRRRWAYLACCALATIQFVWIYMSRTTSGLDLFAYERGLERTPFQYRVLLMKPFQWAHGSALLQGWAERLSGLPAWFPRRIGPEGIAEAALDVASVLAACWAGFALYRRTTRQRLLGWLVWPLILMLSLLTYAGATHHDLRFAYDLPGMAAFSICLLLLYDGKSLLAFYAAFAVATLNRETSLLLLPFLVLRDRARSVRPGATALACVPPLAFWAGLHFYLVHRFAGNGTASGPRLLLNAGSLLVPFSWPQIFCALGYLWPFIFLDRRWIRDPVLRSWLAGYGIWLLFMMFFGLLVEPRIFGELIPLTACLLALILEERLSAPSIQSQPPVSSCHDRRVFASHELPGVGGANP